MLDGDCDGLAPSSIPFKYVPLPIIHQLAMLLDPPIVARCKDWKGLADKLGYIAQEIYVFESRQTYDGSNTKKLLAEYSMNKPGNNVGQVLDALEQLERNDAYDLLCGALPEIRRKKRERESPPRQSVGDPQQNLCSFPSAGYGPPQRVMFDSGHVYELQGQSNSQQQLTGQPMLSMFPFPSGATDHHGYAHRTISDPGLMTTDTSQQRYAERVQRSMSGGSVSVANSGRTYQPLRTQNPGDRHIPFPRSNSTCDRVDEVMETETGDRVRKRSYPCMSDSRAMDVGAEEVVHTSALELTARRENGESIEMNSANSFISLPNIESSSMSYRTLMESVGNDVGSGDWNAVNSMTNLYANNQSYEMQYDLNARSSTGKGSMPPVPSTSFSEDACQVPSPCSKSDITVGTRPIKYNFLHPCETFPKGAKDKQRSEIPKAMRGVQQERTLQYQYRSISEPRNISPAPFGTARRETRVFITYASDSRGHLNRIMSAADNLRKNGFAVSCDMYEKEFVNHSEESRDSWLKKRYTDADFILICISPLYYQQVLSYNEAYTHERSMHETYIYKMMEHELRVLGRPSRFICLLFKDASREHIPVLFQRHVPVYSWPSQYKDLFFKLIKPEQILSSSRPPTSQKGKSDSPEKSSSIAKGVRNPVIIRREVT